MAVVRSGMLSDRRISGTVGILTTSTRYSSEILLREKGFKMDLLKVEFIIAIVMLAITLFLLIKVVTQEVEADMFEFKRRNRWRRWKKRRKHK